MAREHGASEQPWGTLEELLLACAVNRHGTKSWESIAMELQRRSSTLASALTPQYCRDKFDDLKRRFMPVKDDESASLVPMVDELRRIRVEELRREVQRRDVSIVSLELKVKRLEEERERSLKEEAEAVDLKNNLEGDGRETAPAPAPENLAGKSLSDEKENRSLNESNSTSQRADGQRPPLNGVVEEQVRPEPSGNDTDPGRPDPARDKASSFDNGKVEDIEVKTTELGRLGESNEGLESVDELKREKEENSKQSSDVQSSASLSKRKRRRRDGGGGSSSGEEPEGDEVSPATKRLMAIKSEPLVKLLGIIRSHRLGSAFERRLRSQESERYKSLIRQHMDLQTVQCRLDRGAYADRIPKFFRDLLLVFNNGVIFFRKGSSEHVAAKELRSLVRKEMNNMLLRKFQPRAVKAEPKQEPDSLSKPTKSSGIVACGKRSSMKALIGEGGNRKVDKREKELEEKLSVTQKKNDVSFDKMEKGIRKKRSKESFGRRSTRTSNKGGNLKHEYGGNELSSHDALEVKTEKKEDMVKKKQGAASFLKRMKQNSPSEVTEDDDETSEDDSGDGRREEEEKKKRGRKKEGIKREERVTRSSSGGRGGKENTKVKRGVGRPPKRPESVAMAAAAKRGRDNGETEVGGGAGRSRKRSRR